MLSFWLHTSLWDLEGDGDCTHSRGNWVSSYKCHQYFRNVTSFHMYLIMSESGFERKFFLFLPVYHWHWSGWVRLCWGNKWLQISEAHHNQARFLTHVPWQLGLWSMSCLQQDPADKAACSWNLATHAAEWRVKSSGSHAGSRSLW